MESFLQDLLSSQDLTPEQEKALEAHTKEVAVYLKEKFGTEPVIKYAGSQAKGTMIQDNFDLDIVCYFPSGDSRSLKEIRESVAQHLSQKYILFKKASAERILSLKDKSTPDSYHIDVVPGRFIADSKDVFLHVSYGEKERMQTNLKTHIDHIANSGCVDIIRLMKLWVHRNNVPLKTFILELFVVKTLSGSKNKGKLKESIHEVLQVLKDDFESARLVDPANSNNVVSEIMNGFDKAMVKINAENALNALSKSDSLETWQSIFKVTPKAAPTPKPASPIIAPIKPWGMMM